MMSSFLKDQKTYNGEIDKFVSQRYKVVALLSMGGTAEIYQAIDTSNKSKVVIKILPSHYSAVNEKGKNDSKGKTLDISHRIIDRSVEFITQEANFLKNCNHPNIIPLPDHNLNAKRPYIVLNYLGNSTLEKEILYSPRNFSIKKTLNILKQIGAALGYVHKKGFVYCDIKPSNIISRQQKFTLIDFGLIKPIGMAVSGGTIGYMPPELLQSDKGQVKASPAMDIYSLGILLYELLTGFHPLATQKIYDANNRYSFEIQRAIPNLASDLNPFLSKTIDEILLKCINKIPEDRYQNIDTLYLD
ncbi:MAG: serine/threonine-protein kinase, partial [Leadbetterella sp.]|nr:serine/threonine-protein kinase [Leadbetterella sp.]